MFIECRTCGSMYVPKNDSEISCCRFCGLPPDQEKQIRPSRSLAFLPVFKNILLLTLPFLFWGLSKGHYSVDKRSIAYQVNTSNRKEISREARNLLLEAKGKTVSACQRELSKSRWSYNLSKSTLKEFCGCIYDQTSEDVIEDIMAASIIKTNAVEFILENFALASVAHEYIPPTQCRNKLRNNVMKDYAIAEKRTSREPMKTPRYFYEPASHVTEKEHQTIRDGIRLVQKYINSSDFQNFFATRNTNFTHVKISNAYARKIFRLQLDYAPSILVQSVWIKRGDYVAFWDGYSINLNSRFTRERDAYGVAGTLVHETSHAFGWRHKGNTVKKYGNVNSLPYAIGYDFEDYLRAKFTGEVFLEVPRMIILLPASIAKI